MKKAPSNIVYLLSLFLLSACSSRQQEWKEAQDLLFPVINRQYEDYYKVKSLSADLDSIYLNGNELIDHIGDPMYRNRYMKFWEKYTDIAPNPKEWKKDEALKTRIRITQLNAINQLILNFHRSHFQVDLLGIAALNKDFQAYKSGKVDLLPYYKASHSHPLIIVDTDTLKYNGQVYEYEWKGKDTGTYFIATEIIMERWGGLRNYNPTFRIDVD